MTVTVYPTVPPGTVSAVSAVLRRVSPGSRTSVRAVQRGSVPPAGQVPPGAAETRVPVTTRSPGSGLRTVRVPVTVTTPPTGMSPVQVISDAPRLSVPDEAVWSPFGIASSTVPWVPLRTVTPV